MHLLVFVAIVGVAGVLGVGYLGNDVNLWIQQFGVGEGIIESPVTDTELTLQIERVNNPVGFDDFIVQCNFVSLDVDLQPGTKLYCKLFDGIDINASFILASGFVELTDPVPAGEIIEIPITTFLFSGSNNVDFVQNTLVEIQNPSQ